MSQQFEVMPQGYGFSSFGAENTTFKALDVIDSERFRILDFKQSYYDCTQHDWKRYDWDGRMVSGSPITQPTLATEVAPYTVPMKYRRPSDPYRLAKVMVKRFTNLVFGEGRWPTVQVEGNFEAQDFAQALIKAQHLPEKMVEARNMGGKTGSVGLSWCFHQGKPRSEVHNPKNVIVHEWEDREELIPRYVSEIYRYYRDVWNYDKRQLERKWFWFRRDWTPKGDLVYQEVPFVFNQEPFFVLDEKKSVIHDDGECHFVWIQNVPAASDVDGECDYEGLYENLDNLDILNSIIQRSIALNLDPTLVLKVDQDEYNVQGGIKKGSDNALTLSREDDVSYLELGGSSIQVALATFESKRKYALEVAECVILDPDTVASQGMSSVSMKAMYAPMTAKADIFRGQYGGGIERLINAQLRVARRYMNTNNTVVSLPPRYEEQPVKDQAGYDTGEVQMMPVERIPGESGDIDLVWPPYFKPTPDDQQKTVGTLSQANGGKPILSPETTTEIAAAIFGLDPHLEKQRVQAAKEEAKAEQAMLMTDLDDAAGGKVLDQDTIPE